MIVKPFKMGGIGPDEFDNSGFIYYCFKESGVAVPRLTGDLYKAGTAVEKADLKPGDVVFLSLIHICSGLSKNGGPAPAGEG